MNVSPLVGAIVTSKLASLHELETIYGIEGAYDLLEIISVNGHNQRIASKARKS